MVFGAIRTQNGGFTTELRDVGMYARKHHKIINWSSVNPCRLSMMLELKNPKCDTSKLFLVGACLDRTNQSPLRRKYRRDLNELIEMCTANGIEIYDLRDGV